MKHYEDYDQWTKELLDQGKNYSEIGKIQNRSRHSVWAHCKIRGWLREKKTNDVRREIAIERMREQIDEKGFILVDCIGGSDGIIHIKCKECGGILERKAEVARHRYRILCEHCREIRHEQQAQELREQREKAEAERAEARAKRIVYKQQSFFVCPECGGVFYSKRKYCSNKCARKANDRKKDLVRRTRTQEQLVDNNISLKAVYEKDNGVCYICGEKCDWNDYTYRGNTFIAGNKYPSIEHVIALSNGGEHSWNNVRLACRICNSLKSNKQYAPWVEKSS